MPLHKLIYLLIKTVKACFALEASTIMSLEQRIAD